MAVKFAKISTIRKLAKPMDRNDWDAFAGAKRGSKVYYGRTFTYFVEPYGVIVAVKHDRNYGPVQYEYFNGHWHRTI